MKKATKALTPCQKSLLQAIKQGRPKPIALSPLPAKWDAKKAAAAKNKKKSSGHKAPRHPQLETGLRKREIKKVGMKESEIGTSNDSLQTEGLGTCFGVAVTMESPHGLTNKILAHVGPWDTQQQIDSLGRKVAIAAMDAIYPNLEFYISLPDMPSQLQDMIESGDVDRNDRTMPAAMNALQQVIIDGVRGIASRTSSDVHSATRQPGMRPNPYGMLEIRPNNVVVHEGRPWP